MPNRHDPSRRRFIATAAGGLIGAGLPAMAAESVPRKSVIHLFMSGGMSQLDTFDPKPGCPAATATNVPGVFINESLPMLAARMDKIMLFRAMSHGSKSHGAAREAALDFPMGWNFASPSRRGFHRQVSDAIRMVGNGERFIRIELGGWDTHTDNARRTSTLAKTLDQGFSKLLDSLSATGMFDDTLIVLSTEFGRSAALNGFGGREHHPGAYSCLIAGGGTIGGRVIEETTSPAQFIAMTAGWLGSSSLA